MKPLLASLNLLEIHHLKNVLEADGIRCWVRNELLSRLAGEIPFIECAMELHLAPSAAPGRGLDLRRLRRECGGTVRRVLALRRCAAGR